MLAEGGEAQEVYAYPACATATWAATAWPATDPTLLPVAELDGPEVALAAAEHLADKLADYHPCHATRADLLRRLGRSRLSQNHHHSERLSGYPLPARAPLASSRPLSRSSPAVWPP